MKYVLQLLILNMMWPLAVKGQVIVTDPVLPTADQSVTIYFDATKGTGGLMGYTGDVYAHTGVLIHSSNSDSDWKYVKTNWGENTPETMLTRESANLYSLQITPSVMEYYGVSLSDTITHMAFVFRSEDASLEGKEEGGKDIFAEVFGDGLQVKVLDPQDEVQIVERNDPLEFSATAANADTMALYLNGSFLKGVGRTNEIRATLPTETMGEFDVVLWASNPDEEIMDSIYYIVRNVTVTESLPDGVIDGINYMSDTTVVLSLFAPGKEYVYAVGDFTGWKPRENFQMKNTPDGNHFWLRAGNLEPGETYRFQYLVDGTLAIPDPNTELLVDPSNDQYISEYTYPGIQTLYQGLPEGQFSVIETAKEPFKWDTEDFIPPPEETLVIYELLLRDFLQAHDWKTLTDTLDYLDSLGINAIELMPFNEFSGNESWGYNPIYWMSPDKYYGTGDALRAFVDECHGRGIAVIQDIVFNHVDSWSAYVSLFTDIKGFPSEENPWVNEDHDPDDPNGWYQACHPYNVFFDFDHSSIHTQQLIDRSTRYWMEEYKIDGFRFDLAKGFTQQSTYLGTDSNGHAIYNESAASAYNTERISYLKRMADSIWAFNDQAYVILEHFCDNREEKELSDYGMMLWGNLNYNYGEAVMGYHENGKSDFSWISYRKRGWNDPHVVGYMESHDEERLMYKMRTFGKTTQDYSTRDLGTALERMELAGAFFFTIPGPKLFWQFGELGYDISIDYGCRICNKPIRWDYYTEGKRKKLYQVWSALIKLRTGQPAFSSADFTLNLTEEVKRIEINHDDMDVRIIGNFDVTKQSADPSFSRTGWWFDFFGGDSIQVTDLHAEIALDPGQFRIYTTKKLSKPEITAGSYLHKAAPNRFRIYPNPANDMLFMEPVHQKAWISVYDPAGKCVMESPLQQGEYQIDISMLPAGIYIVTRRTEKHPAAYATMVKLVR
jgi:1,4-alpha-glucan branching enzyme